MKLDPLSPVHMLPPEPGPLPLRGDVRNGWPKSQRGPVPSFFCYHVSTIRISWNLKLGLLQILAYSPGFTNYLP